MDNENETKYNYWLSRMGYMATLKNKGLTKYDIAAIPVNIMIDAIMQTDPDLISYVSMQSPGIIQVNGHDV